MHSFLPGPRTQLYAESNHLSFDMSANVDERVTDEVEALAAILMADVVIKKVNGVPQTIETVVHPSTGDNIDQQYVCITLEVKLTSGYPEVSPEVTLRNPRGLDDQILATIDSQIKNKLIEGIGQPVVFELIEVIRENLTKSNLPSGQCVICLYQFTEGDVFIKTQCYHYFHSQCLAKHLISGKKYYEEEFEKLPNWQQMHATPYQQTCPVCRSSVSCDVETLKKAPPPVESLTEPPFSLTPELQALQVKMAALLAHQVAKGGVVGVGDTGPPPLTITSPSDNNENRARNSSSGSQESAKPSADAIGTASPNGSASNDAAPGSPQARQYRGPFRGFKRSSRAGRRGRGPPAAR